MPLLLLGSFVMTVGVSPVVTLATDIIVGSAPPEQAGAVGLPARPVWSRSGCAACPRLPQAESRRSRK